MPTTSLLRRGVRAAVIVAATALALTACSADAGGAGVPVRVLYVGTPGTDPAFVEGDLATQLEKVGATPQEAGFFPATAPLLEALNGNQGDVAFLVSSGALTALSGGADFKILAIGREDDDVAGSSSSIVVPEGSGIHSVDDLAGKSVAVNKGGAGEYMLDVTLINHGVDPNTVTKVYLGPGDAAAAFSNGSVDAWAAFSTFIPAALGNMGARLLASGADELEGRFDQAIVVVRTPFLDAHPELMGPIVDGFAEGAKKVKADPSEVLRTQQEANGLSDSQVEYLKETLLSFEPITDETKAQLQSMADIWYQAGTLPTRLDIDALTVSVDQP